MGKKKLSVIIPCIVATAIINAEVEKENHLRSDPTIEHPPAQSPVKNFNGDNSNNTKVSQPSVQEKYSKHQPEWVEQNERILRESLEADKAKLRADKAKLRAEETKRLRDDGWQSVANNDSELLEGLNLKNKPQHISIRGVRYKEIDYYLYDKTNRNENDEDLMATHQFTPRSKTFLGQAGEILCEVEKQDVVNCPPTLANVWPDIIGDWRFNGTHMGIVTSVNGEVKLLQSRTSIMSLLVPIDSPNKAVLWARIYDFKVNASQLVVKKMGVNFLVKAHKTTSDCPVTNRHYHLTITPEGNIEETVTGSSTSGVCIGRIPEGLFGFTAEKGEDPVGVHFAKACQLEAAAVHAFQGIAHELTHFGAPKDLIDRSLDAARDEQRHTEQMRTLARRYGVEPGEPLVESYTQRSLFAFAMENALEGCVRETLGAVIGHYQACTADDAEIKRTMASVAEDETRHAQLSWDIAEWVEDQLDDESLTQLRYAQHEATAQALNNMPHYPLAFRALIGAPSEQVTQTLANELWARLLD